MSIAVSVLYRLKESSVFFGKRNNDKDENLDKTGIRFVFAYYLKRKDNGKEGTSIKTGATYDNLEEDELLQELPIRNIFVAFRNFFCFFVAAVDRLVSFSDRILVCPIGLLLQKVA